MVENAESQILLSVYGRIVAGLLIKKKRFGVEPRSRLLISSK